LTKSWVVGDHRGVPVNAGGARANTPNAFPFGRRWQRRRRRRWCSRGQLVDGTDRFDNRHRDDDPALGRYLQADSIGLNARVR
jgi:uncharacterized protein RhaS with RHS repeats